MDKEFNRKLAFITETDGFLRDYITTQVIPGIKSGLKKGNYNKVNSNHIHAALMLSRMEPCSLKDFASMMRLSKSSASALIDRMVDGSIIRRDQNPENRREVLLSLVPEFAEHIKGVKKELSLWFNDLIGELGEDLFEKWYEVMGKLDEILKDRINEINK